MNFYVYINGKTHKLVQGFTISEEYNETLDSASIIISNSPQLDINPYDDVFIYSEYCGYFDADCGKIVPNYDKKFIFKGYPINNANLYAKKEKPFFYKHFLIYKFVERIIILGEKEEDTRYEYTIELFSETKGLETIQAPNISITQSLNKKIPTYVYINRFLSLYNKRIKKTSKEIIDWEYYSKYTLGDVYNNSYVYCKKISPFTIRGNTYSFNSTSFTVGIFNFTGTVENLTEITDSETISNLGFDIFKNCRFYTVDNKNFAFFVTGSFSEVKIFDDNYRIPSLLTNVSEVFSDSFAPDFTLNSPSLRQILEKLFITKDCIPVVFDDQIYAMDITLRRGKFDLKKGQINYITGSKNSDNYCTDLKRTYSNALTQENSSRFVDFLGFRNSDSGLLNLSNLRIETRFPIYKINKVYMCYFKRIKYVENSENPVNKIFLCKQDITKLVKLNSERNVLSEDIEDFNLTPKSSIDDMAKYKFATVGYDIGSNYIEGWGTKYSYPTSNFFWQTEVKSYIENLFNYMDREHPYGIYDFDYLIKKIVGEDGTIPNNYGFYPFGGIDNTIVIPDENIYNDADKGWFDTIIGLLDSPLEDVNLTLHLKHLFFQIDYQGFYNGTVIHSKGLGKDNLTINDNPSSSLTLLELDGSAQKEKLNRYGNKGIQINARYKDINDVQLLGSVYEHNNDKDVVIYHKEYSINDNVIDCSYSGTRDYVLKDYFTSVYAKHRTYNLMSYSESITRSENQKIYFVISKNKIINDKNLGVSFDGFNTNFIKTFFSFWEGVKTIEAYGRINESEKINYGLFKKGDDYYATDINVFVSGVSLCLNICMFDNITSGTYISKMKNYYFAYNTSNYVIGATQKWVNLVDDMTTGQINKMGFYFGHIQGGKEYGYIDEDTIYDDNANKENDFDRKAMYDKILSLPKIIGSPKIKNQIYFDKTVYKDNKEKIDMTLQIEPIVDNEIYISPWFSKLSNLFSVYEKYNKDIPYSFSKKEEIFNDLIFNTRAGSYGGDNHPFPVLIIAINKKEENWLEKYPPQFTGGIEIEGSILLNNRATVEQTANGRYVNFSVNFKNLISVSEDELKIIGDISYSIYNAQSGEDGNGVYNDYTFTLSSSEMFEYQVNNSVPMQNVYSTIKNNFLYAKGYKDDDYKVYMCGIINGTIASQTFNGIEWACWAGDGNMYTDKVDGYVKHQFLKGNTLKYAEDKKNKNLYWVYTPSYYEFREYMVYDELGSLSTFSPLTVWELGDEVSSNNIQFTWIGDNKLKIIHPVLNYGSHILCYYKTENGKYNFVFGFKPDENSSKSGKTNSFTELNMSLLSFKDLTVYDSDSNLPVGNIPDNESII